MAERRRACILAGMGNKNWPDEIRTAARSLYLRRYAVSEIADMLSVPVRTLYNWADAGRWDDLLSHEGAEEAASRRLALLLEREDKSPRDLKEVDTLVGTLERLQKLRLREKEAREGRNAEGSPPGASGEKERKGKKKAAVKNDVSRLTGDDFAEAFHKRFFPYQRELLERNGTGTAFSSRAVRSASPGFSRKRRSRTPVSRATTRSSCPLRGHRRRCSAHTSSRWRKRSST